MGCGTCGGCGSGGVELPEGLVTEIVLADERDAPAVAEAAAPGDRWPAVDGDGVDQVKLAILWSLLGGGEACDALVLAFAPLAEVSADGPWVFRVPPGLVAALSALEAARAAGIASAWAEAEELVLEDRDPAGVRALLDRLRGIARAAAAARRPLLMRVST